MHTLLIILIILPTIHCNVIKETREWLEYDTWMQQNFHLVGPPENTNLIVDDLFIQYPALKPSSAADIIELKKSFLEFHPTNQSMISVIIAGAPAKHKQLAQMLTTLLGIAKEEFEHLSEDEQQFVETVNGFVWHKLSAQASLKVLKKKKAVYARKKMSKDDYLMDSTMKSVLVLISWGINPDDYFEEVSKRHNIDEL